MSVWFWIMKRFMIFASVHSSSLLLAVSSSFLSLFDFVVWLLSFIVTFFVLVCLILCLFALIFYLIMFGLMGFKNCFRNKTIMFE